jgi:hypothetical protein
VVGKPRQLQAYGWPTFRNESGDQYRREKMDDQEPKRLQNIADNLAHQVECKVHVIEHFDRIEILSDKELKTFRGFPGPTFLYTALPPESLA